MAQKIKAIKAFRPPIEQSSTFQKSKLLRAVSTPLRFEGSVDLVTKEMREQIILFWSAGRAVMVEGLGSLSPSIDLEGNIAISFHADSTSANGLNMPEPFCGTNNAPTIRLASHRTNPLSMNNAQK